MQFTKAVNRVSTELKDVGAHAKAMALKSEVNMIIGKAQIVKAGIGNYRGRAAGAIGIAHYRTEKILCLFNKRCFLGTSQKHIK